MHLEKIKSIYPTVLLVVALILGSLYTTHLIVTEGLFMGPLVAVSLGSLVGLGLMIRQYKIGIYLIFVLSVFMSFLNRMTGLQIPYGIFTDLLAGLTFLIMLFSNKQKTNWSHLRSSITYFYIFIVVYQLLQVFNPNATSFIGWIVAFRMNTSFLLFFAFYHLFQSLEEVKKFTILWVVLASIVAIYGIWQEVVGLNPMERAWVYNDPIRKGLYLIWGHLRVFSLLSDPAAFGLFMGFSGLACFVLMMGPFSALLRITLGFFSAIMFISMSYSGTRTAIAMVAVGIAFYVLITLKSRKTFLILIFGGMGVAALLFGPFYTGTVLRIRSTLKVDQDASMNVRDKKRIRLQWYVQSHPFGGGLNTTGMNGVKYSPGHYLAEGWDPDSGYLLTALETGWVGLLLSISFFFVTVLKGINNYFSINDPLVKTYNLAYIVPFFALSVAHYTQDAMFQKPAYLVIIATYAVMLNIPSHDKRVNNP
jgi:putative inorganic carbon (hco3(-)) transporter